MAYYVAVIVKRPIMNAVDFATASIARKIRDRRREAGLSQGAVASKAKIRQETLSRLEHGHGNPTVDVIGRIAWAIERLDKKKTSARSIRQAQTLDSRKKVIQAEINNSDLNALEDILHCVLTPKNRRIAEEKARRLWNALVTAWDNPSQTPQQPAAKRPRAAAGSSGVSTTGFIPVDRVRNTPNISIKG
jgi:transcriptional regulator with XRE-family HTH domain